MSVKKKKQSGALRKWLVITFDHFSFSPLLSNCWYKSLLLGSVLEWPLPAVFIVNCISVIGFTSLIFCKLLFLPFHFNQFHHLPCSLSCSSLGLSANWYFLCEIQTSSFFCQFHLWDGTIDRHLQYQTVGYCNILIKFYENKLIQLHPSISAIQCYPYLSLVHTWLFSFLTHPLEYFFLILFRAPELFHFICFVCFLLM